MSLITLNSRGTDVTALQQDLVKHGFNSIGHAFNDKPGIFGTATLDLVVEFQKTHHDESGEPLVADGIVGPNTQWALKNDSELEPHPGSSLIPMRAIRLPFYADQQIHTFWLAAEVADSFLEGISKWQETDGDYIVTGTYRSVAAQAVARNAKPTLCCAPGWSLHAHGRAVDGHIRPENSGLLVKFYEHMQKFGWFTIFNHPNKPVVYQPRESWHIQKTDPAGISSREYLIKWAAAHGGSDSLMLVQKKEEYA